MLYFFVCFLCFHPDERSRTTKKGNRTERRKKKYKAIFPNLNWSNLSTNKIKRHDKMKRIFHSFRMRNNKNPATFFSHTVNDQQSGAETQIHVYHLTLLFYRARASQHEIVSFLRVEKMKKQFFFIRSKVFFISRRARSSQRRWESNLHFLIYYPRWIFLEENSFA